MLTIKTEYMKIEREDNRLLSANYSMGTIYMKFVDQIDINIPYEGDKGKINAIMNMALNTKAENVLLDFTDKENLISFS